MNAFMHSITKSSQLVSTKKIIFRLWWQVQALEQDLRTLEDRQGLVMVVVEVGANLKIVLAPSMEISQGPRRLVALVVVEVVIV